MEAFSLLKYWRGNGGGGVNVTGVGDSGVNTRTAETTTIVAAVSQTDDENEDNNDDEPFFDLEFTVPDEEEEENQGKENENENENESEVEVLEEEEDEDADNDDEGEDDEFDNGGGEEREFKFTLSFGSGSGSCNVDRANPNWVISSSSCSSSAYQNGRSTVEIQQSRYKKCLIIYDGAKKKEKTAQANKYPADTFTSAPED